MSQIKILPEILSNKIAAGEVVERPASVVKELMENALDAGSSRIMIEVQKGGRSLIRVSDDGCGMSRDDALLSLERYATSKIYTDQDLFEIGTLGFRGEAVPSIASVSRFTLVTCARGEEPGTKIRVRGGKIIDVTDVGAPPGTMAVVEQLFFNTPARRKFLKTVSTEMSHIADTVARLALGWPGVHIGLTHNGKSIKSWAAAAAPLDRVIDVLGRECKNRLYPVALDDGRLRVSGWVSSPRLNRTTPRGTHVYVNGRFVRDRMIQHALFAGYGARLVKGQFPLAVLFIELSPGGVDVNVHPTKHEVRFGKPRAVHQAVVEAVESTLKTRDRPLWAPRPPDSGRDPDPPPLATEPLATYRSKNGEPRQAMKEATRAETGPGPPVEQHRLWPEQKFGRLRIIGQFDDTYILCEARRELVLIDQHAAHERVVYEQLKRQVRGEKLPVQQLLIPEPVELGFREADVLGKMIPDLSRFGLEIEPFGGSTFMVKAMPALIDGRDPTALVRALVDRVAAGGFTPGLAKTIDECLAVMACHGVIRAHQRLTDNEIQSLLEQLDACDNPSNCPHGRPTWIRWPLKFLEKAFGRTV